jgi:Mg2+ and Co2+ transporter CorA
MDVRLVGPDGVRALDAGDVVPGPAPDDGFVWVDVPEWDDDAERLLERLGCHPLVLEACRTRNHVPTVHAYEQHVFVTLLAPLLGTGGHVHLLELDQLVGRHYLITVHGPLNPSLDPAEALVETRAALRRIEEGRFRPESPAALSYALGSAVARRQRALIGAVAEKLPAVEQEVMASEFREPEALLEQMFLIRHELLTGRTTAAQSADVFARIASLDRHVDDELRRYTRDLADQFDRVRSIGDGESQFLHGVIELYQTRVNTKMTVAMERLAVIAAVTLPVTAIASVLGMNVIVSDSTRWVELAGVLAVMLTISFLLLRWARRQGWW